MRTTLTHLPPEAGSEDGKCWSVTAMTIGEVFLVPMAVCGVSHVMQMFVCGSKELAMFWCVFVGMSVLLARKHLCIPMFVSKDPEVGGVVVVVVQSSMLCV